MAFKDWLFLKAVISSGLINLNLYSHAQFGLCIHVDHSTLYILMSKFEFKFYLYQAGFKVKKYTKSDHFCFHHLHI